MFEREYYHAKLWHFVFPLALLAVGSLLIGAGSPAWKFTGWALAGLGILLGALVLPLLLVMTAKTEGDKALAEYALAVKGMTPDQFDALGLRVPTVRIKRGKDLVEVCFEDTICTLDVLREIVEGSNNYQIHEERALTGSRRRQWQDLVDWLLDHQYLVPESAAGSHSYLWYEGRFQQLKAAYARYVRAGLVDLGEQERQSMRAVEA